MTDEPNPSSKRLASSAGVAGTATMSSRLLGLIREQVLASLFGAGNAMDAFNVAFRIPNLMRDLFAEGAMSAAFVPTFTKELATKGKEAAWRLGSLVLNSLLVITGLLVVAGLIFSEPMVKAFAGSYIDVPGKLDLTVHLTRIILPFLTLVALAAAVMGMLNSLNRFFIPALSPAMFNVGIIACAIFLVPVMSLVGLQPITAIAIGALVGGLGQLALQLPLLIREGFRYRPIFNFRDPGLRQVLLLMGPATLGLAATQINLFVNTVLATGEGTGAVSWLNYAFRIMYLPIGIFGVSVATASVPAVSRQAAVNDAPGIRKTVADSLSLMMVMNIPATVGLIVLASPIVQILFERRAFTPLDTAATAAALQLYAIGLLGYAAVRITSPVFYALGQSRIPATVTVVIVLVNVGLNLFFVQLFGYRGLALGTSLAALLNASTLLFLLRRRLGGLEDSRILLTLIKIMTAAILMGLAVSWVEATVNQWLPGDAIFLQLIKLSIAISAGIAVLTTTAHLLRVNEFREAMSLLTRRFGRH